MLRLGVSKKEKEEAPRVRRQSANMQDADLAERPSGVKSPLIVNHYFVLKIKG